MFTEQVPIVEDGSLNGYVLHQSICAQPVPTQYRVVMSAAGIGHPKHGGDVGPGMAGQDVYGHTARSIFVADGHGADGLDAALKTSGVVNAIEDVISTRDLLLNPERTAEKIRSEVVRHMHDCVFETAGSTFTQMTLVESNARRWAVTVNVGDSEALLVYKHKVVVCSVPHVWDSRAMYQRYLNHSARRKPVCYNRWNASQYSMRDPEGGHRPIMMYSVDEHNRAVVRPGNATWMSELWQRRNRPALRYGTQSVRMPAEPHENWGSAVMVGGRARGQVMATFGDTHERRQTGVPLNMIHVYVHEIPFREDVIAIAQSDGVSNARTLEDCAYKAWRSKSAADYLSGIAAPKDDMSAAIAYLTKG
jgi:serine/threonine protein phosphatase PrpC